MARTIKPGLTYFPLDVDFFQDEKIEFVSARFEEKGELIAIKLLCKIYRNGYFIQWDEDSALLFAKTAGKNITSGLVNDVVNELLKRGFFDKDLYMRFKILTSNGIQSRYEFICKASRRKYEILDKYRVKEINSEKNDLNSEEKPENDVVEYTNKSKVNKSKVNKSKIKESKEELSLDFISPEFSEIFNKWLEYKKSRRESYKNDDSLELCYKGLIKKSKNNPQLAKIIVERSMENNWAGLFELPVQELNKMNISPINVNQNATREDYTTLN